MLIIIISSHTLIYMDGTRIITVKEIIEENKSSEIVDAKLLETVEKMEKTDC